MSDEKTESTAEIVKAVATLVEAVPVYQDAVQPAAKEIGKSLELVAKAVTAVLAPLELLVWGVDKIREFVQQRVADKLANTSPENIQAPPPQIGVPVLEALRYAGEDAEVSEMFANLLATSMDKERAFNAHPAFVEIIKSMAPDEARIMRFLAKNGSQGAVDISVYRGFVFRYSLAIRTFEKIIKNYSYISSRAGCDHSNLSAAYLENLKRLGLIFIDEKFELVSSGAYDELEKPLVREVRKNSRKWAFVAFKLKFERRIVGLTPLGKQFVASCVLDSATPALPPTTEMS